MRREFFTVEFERAFVSVYHCMFSSVLRTFGFNENFIRWVRSLLYNKK